MDARFYKRTASALIKVTMGWSSRCLNTLLSTTKSAVVYSAKNLLTKYQRANVKQIFVKLLRLFLQLYGCRLFCCLIFCWSSKACFSSEVDDSNEVYCCSGLLQKFKFYIKKMKLLQLRIFRMNSTQ